MAEAKKATSTAKASTATKTAATKAAPKTAAKPATAAKATAAKAAPKTAAKATDGEKTQLLRLHHLKPAEGAHKARTRVGRGEASKGKTAGRGTKGTKARYQVRVGFEGGQMPLHMRLPKLRGFKNPFRTEYQVVNLDRLERVSPKGGTLGIEDFALNGLVRSGCLVKVLGEGELTQKFNLTADKFSASAVKKIEAAGGSVTLTTPKETTEK